MRDYYTEFLLKEQSRDSDESRENISEYAKEVSAKSAKRIDNDEKGAFGTFGTACSSVSGNISAPGNEFPPFEKDESFFREIGAENGFWAEYEAQRKVLTPKYGTAYASSLALNALLKNYF